MGKEGEEGIVYCIFFPHQLYTSDLVSTTLLQKNAQFNHIANDCCGTIPCNSTEIDIPTMFLPGNKIGDLII